MGPQVKICKDVQKKGVLSHTHISGQRHSEICKQIIVECHKFRTVSHELVLVSGAIISVTNTPPLSVGKSTLNIFVHLQTSQIGKAATRNPIITFF